MNRGTENYWADLFRAGIENHLNSCTSQISQILGNNDKVSCISPFCLANKVTRCFCHLFMLLSARIWSTTCNKGLVKYVPPPDYITGKHDFPWLYFLGSSSEDRKKKKKKSLSNAFLYFFSRNDKVSLISLTVCFKLLSYSQPFSSQNIKQLLHRLFKSFWSPPSTTTPHWTHSTHTPGFALICRWISFIFTCFSLSTFSEHGYIAFPPKILIGIHNIS